MMITSSRPRLGQDGDSRLGIPVAALLRRRVAARRVLINSLRGFETLPLRLIGADPE
ncbi:hypothetical protein ACQPZQ_10910 [Pseudonocardia sp. CA-142604]|uniref:hypothetical protein n=1 Tax=Pseudonocardia sp. CA-142604 TaxID=3240024 RepID=UPI003D8C8D19